MERISFFEKAYVKTTFFTFNFSWKNTAHIICIQCLIIFVWFLFVCLFVLFFVLFSIVAHKNIDHTLPQINNINDALII